MSGLLIADGQNETRQLLVQLFLSRGFEVAATNSAGCTLCSVYQKRVEVVLLGPTLDGLSSTKLVSLLRGCDRRVAIILVAGPLSMTQLREIRQLGVFYHALPPASAADGEELLQAVACALAERRRYSSQLQCHLACCQVKPEHQP